MSPSTGIIMNNQLSDFNNKGNKRYRLPPFKGNDLKPGKEPQSSMCPMIVLDQKANVRMITGGSGGPLIITTLIQVLINRFWFGYSYDYSVARWRIHHQLIPNKVQYESHNPPPKKLILYLQQKGHLFEPIYRCRRSAANSIFVDYISGKKNIIAVGDGRKHGGIGGY